MLLVVQTTTFILLAADGRIFYLYKPPYSVLPAADGKVCYLRYKPPYVPEYMVKLPALHFFMLEEAFQVCFYPCWACIKISVFVRL
jgi:hypothetical protein